MSQTAIIWGAAGGIGRSVTRLLSDAGWTTVAVSRHPERTEEFATHSFAANVANLVSAEQAVYSASFEIDSADLFIYAAGDIAKAKVGAMTAGDWERLLAANLTGAFFATRASLPILAPDAHLFFLGALSERLQLPSLAAYVAAKAGLEAFAATLAKEERRRKVTVVRPGAVDTPFWDKVDLRKPKDAAQPEQIARRILNAYNDGHTGTLDITH